MGEKTILSFRSASSFKYHRFPGFRPQCWGRWRAVAGMPEAWCSAASNTPLTDRQILHYFELPKLPEVVGSDDGLKLWLSLFKADTEEDLAKIEAMEVTVMTEAIQAYRHVSATDEFKEIERLRSRARHNEASALRHARNEGRSEGEKIGAKREREKWQGVIKEQAAAAEEQAAVVERQAALIAELKAKLGVDK